MGSLLLLSQGQAGLGFPNRSDRSLVTAAVKERNGGGEWGEDMQGGRVQGGREEDNMQSKK